MLYGMKIRTVLGFYFFLINWVCLCLCVNLSHILNGQKESAHSPCCPAFWWGPRMTLHDLIPQCHRTDTNSHIPTSCSDYWTPGCLIPGYSSRNYTKRASTSVTCIVRTAHSEYRTWSQSGFSVSTILSSVSFLGTESCLSPSFIFLPLRYECFLTWFKQLKHKSKC